MMVDDLMEKENGYNNLIKAFYKKIEKIDDEMFNSPSLQEQRKAISDARQQGLPAPSFKSINTLKIEKKQIYEKIRNAKKILVIERNRLCRWCKFPLLEPEEQFDQIGKKFTPVDFKSPVGYRRLDALFHTECAMSWISSKIKLDEKYMKYIQPRRTGQEKLFQTNSLIPQNK